MTIDSFLWIDQLFNFPEMQFQMRQVSFNVFPKRNEFTFATYPLIFKLELVNIPHNMHEMQVAYFHN